MYMCTHTHTHSVHAWHTYMYMYTHHTRILWIVLDDGLSDPGQQLVQKVEAHRWLPHSQINLGKGKQYEFNKVLLRHLYKGDAPL